MADTPNIVIIVADTTRVDDASDPSIAPTLVDLAERGTRATRAVSTAPWTLPAHASLLTGTYSSRHGAHAGHELLDESLPVLPELLGGAGYETVAVSNNTWLSAESGFDRGFDTFRHMWQLVQSEQSMGGLVEVTEDHRLRAVARELLAGNPLANAANVCYRKLVRDRSDDGARRSTAWVADWLGDRDDARPFFLLVNYLEPHLDYDPPRRLAEQHLPDDVSYEEATAVPQEPWEYLAGNLTLSERDLAALRALYRAEITYVDEQLAALRDALVDAGEWDDTLFVVLADHGENVGDHGMMDHQYCLYDTLVQVPLVLHGGAFTDREDLTDLVSLADLAPTLLDAAGVEALERHVEDLPDHVYEYDRSLRAIRTSEYKLIRGSDGSRELYHLTSDPAETRDVTDEYPDVVADLEGRLDAWLEGFEHAEAEDSVELGAERRERLEQLGYLQ